MKNILKKFWFKKKPKKDKLEEAEKQGLITDEELHRLRYERAKEEYSDYLKRNRKKKK